MQPVFTKQLFTTGVHETTTVFTAQRRLGSISVKSSAPKDPPQSTVSPGRLPCLHRAPKQHGHTDANARGPKSSGWKLWGVGHPPCRTSGRPKCPGDLDSKAGLCQPGFPCTCHRWDRSVTFNRSSKHSLFCKITRSWGAEKR